MQRIKEIIFTHGKVGRWSVPIDSGAAAGHGFEFWNEGETIAIEELRIRGEKAEERLPKQSSEMEGFDSESVKLFVRVRFASGFWAIFWQLARPARLEYKPEDVSRLAIKLWIFFANSVSFPSVSRFLWALRLYYCFQGLYRFDFFWIKEQRSQWANWKRAPHAEYSAVLWEALPPLLARNFHFN